MILNLLTEEGKVFVNELSKVFNVSEVTIRNDLDQLEKKNLLIRARGGAMVTNNMVSFDLKISKKNKLNLKEKIKIGVAAAGLVSEGDTIILDSGTTTSEVAKNLEAVRDLTVITNALNIANILINYPNLNLIIPGGMLRKTSLSLVGPIAERSLRNLFVDKLIMGVDGFDTHTGIYTPNVEEAHINNLMISIARKVILVTDSSKFNRRSLAFICGINQIHQVVTDAGIPAEDEKRLRDGGVEVIIAR